MVPGVRYDHGSVGKVGNGILNTTPDWEDEVTQFYAGLRVSESGISFEEIPVSVKAVFFTAEYALRQAQGRRPARGGEPKSRGKERFL